MKRFFTGISMLFLTFLTISCQTQGKQVLFLSDFEDRTPQSWSRLTNELLTTDSRVFREGETSLKIHQLNKGAGGAVFFLSNDIFPGGEYSFSLSLAPEEGNPLEGTLSLILVKGGSRQVVELDADSSQKGEWITLQGNFTAETYYRDVILMVRGETTGQSFYMDEFAFIQTKASPYGKRDPIDYAIPSLASVYEESFSLGAAVEPYQLEGDEGEILKKHFSTLTAENVMKQVSIQPSEGNFTFEEADKIVDFAGENDLAVRGHALVWHHPDQTAYWMVENEAGGKATKEQVLARLETHIKTLVGRYKGKIFAWDVVNEAIDTNEEDNFRRTVWYDAIGPEYIEYAFRYAHEADPEAELFLNDYSTYDKQKGEAIYQLAKDLLEKGVPLHGIGMQFHIGIQYPSLEDFERTLVKFSDLGLKIHITELDMTLSRHEGEFFDSEPEDFLIRQGYRYKAIFDLFEAHSDVIENVTFWGFNDGHTWLTSYPVEKNDWPLLFDRYMEPKYAYWGLADPEMLPEDVDINADMAEAKVAEALYGTPLIDGEKDAIWEKAEVLPIDTFAFGEGGATGEARVLWDEEKLYVYAQITDPVLSKASANDYEHDSLEIFLDEKNDKTMTFGEDDQQYRINYGNSRSYGGYATRIESKTRITSKGYVVEAAIAFLTTKGEVGKEMGFDLQINDDFGGGARDAISKWNDPTNESWRNTMGWGILKLSQRL